MNTFDTMLRRADRHELSDAWGSLVSETRETREKLERSSGRPIARALHRRISWLRARILRIEQAIDAL